MTYQLVPPNNHRGNLAKKAIQSWKDHFIGILSGMAATFPLHLWCQAIPQMEHQLLFLQTSNAPGSLPMHTSTANTTTMLPHSYLLEWSPLCTRNHGAGKHLLSTARKDIFRALLLIITVLGSYG